MDVNSNKLGGTVAERNKRLVKLINGVGDMKLGERIRTTPSTPLATPMST